MKSSFGEFAKTFTKIGLINFGGPAGQIALMHRILVEEKNWINEDDFLSALNFCHLLPGPEAQQLATYIGYKCHGIKGGLFAGIAFILPGALVMFLLSMLYAYSAHIPLIAGVFLGIKAVVLAIVLEALIKISKRALDNKIKILMAVFAFIALYVFKIEFPIIILTALAFGIIFKSYFAPKISNQITNDNIKLSFSYFFKVAAIGVLLWVLPLILIFAFLEKDSVFVDIAGFFMKLSVVTFGGAYAVLSYMAAEAVNNYHWLKPQEMADGLGLAETTPGPLIMVTQFVGFLAGFRNSGYLPAIWGGALGSIITTWVTFVPSFVFIFSLAPIMEKLKSIIWIKSGLAAISASIVGIIANLTIWFAMHTLFSQVQSSNIFGLNLELPILSTINYRVTIIAIAAIFMIFKLRLSIMQTLLFGAILGIAFNAIV